MTIAESNKNLTETALLVEYQKAIDSAQHYETLAWSITSVTWASSFILLGFSINSLDKNPNALLISILSIIGMLMVIAEWYQHLQFQNVKKQKYQRCNEIEKILNLYQNRSLESYRNIQRCVFRSVTMMLLLIWPLVIYLAWDT